MGGEVIADKDRYPYTLPTGDLLPDRLPVVHVDLHEPLRSDHEWDDPDLAPPPQTRSSYDNIPYTD